MKSKRPVQGWAQKKRLSFFKKELKESVNILEIGAGSGWVKRALIDFKNVNYYTGVDLFPPADIVGDINNWLQLGLKPGSFDTIIAFEVVEHVDCFDACYQLLRPGGKMLITTPVPEMDWLLKITEALGINQKRTSPHDHLVDLRKVTFFNQKKIKIVLGLGQWAVFTK
jgi:cyclopropane fatty-acyl-phospholipid synthase-like methyltransferase